MSLEQEVRDYIDQTMSLEASTTTGTEGGTLAALIAGLRVMEEAILMVARRVDERSL